MRNSYAAAATALRVASPLHNPVLRVTSCSSDRNRTFHPWPSGAWHPRQSIQTGDTVGKRLWALREKIEVGGEAL